MEETEGRGVCFIAMPIRAAGTEEHRHFLGIFELLKSTVEAQGYAVVRSDQSNTPGNLNKEIITQLAEAQVAIADLSDLNPNVFYELGVRHALRRSGTIILIDKQKSPTIPFDLGSYRVIQYEGDVAGIGALLDQTRSTLASLASVTDASVRLSDSPVHDWYPELPSDLIAHGKATVQPEMTRELVSLRAEVETLRERVQNQDSSGGSSTSRPSSANRLITQLRQASQNGDISTEALRRAERAVTETDLSGFLEAAEHFLSARDTPTRNNFLQFHNWSRMLGQEALGFAILEEAKRRSPEDGQLEREINLRRAQSRRREDRDQAKAWFAGEIGLDLETWKLDVSHRGTAKAVDLVGHLLEVLHQEDEDEHGLEILEQSMIATDKVAHPAYQRNLARQYDWLGRNEDALRAYQEAIQGATAQEGIRWFGNFCHNNGLHIEAVELFALEGFYDLDDPSGPLNVANDLHLHLFDYFGLKSMGNGPSREPAELPAAVGYEDVIMGLRCALSCTDALDFAQRQLLAALSRRLGQEWKLVSESPLVARPERLEWLAKIYGAVRSEISTGCSVGDRLLNQGESPTKSIDSEVFG